MRTVTALAAILALTGSARATVQSQAGNASALSAGAATTGSLESASAGSGAAFGQAAAPAPVVAGSGLGPGGYATAGFTASAPAAPQGLRTAEVPPPGKGVLQKTGDALKGLGEKAKPYVPHALMTGVGVGAGLVAAKVAGFGLLGGALAGGAIGLGAYMLYKHGQTGASIGALSLGVAGLALGGPVGGIVGALIGGIGAWALGKFFA